MKIVVLGDTHGSTLWKKIIEDEQPDKVIFLGDYFDPYNKFLIKGMYDNFKEILKYKKKNKDKCILLIGNHDYHYMSFGTNYSTRYSMDTYDKYAKTLNTLYADHTMVFAHQEDNIIFTHAGISKFWLENIAQLKEDTFTVDDINSVNPALFEFNNYTDQWDAYGDSVSQSPIWIRPQALLKSSIKNYIQIVGHTRMYRPCKEENIWFNDAIEHDGYIMIEDGNIEKKFYKIKKK